MPSVTRHITSVSEGSPGFLSKDTTQLDIAYTPATIDANVPLSVCESKFHFVVKYNTKHNKKNYSVH